MCSNWDSVSWHAPCRRKPPSCSARRGGKVSAVETDDGRMLPAELVGYGIGVIPNGELAAAAGLDVHNGIRVDETLLTEDPAISAIGDAVNFPSPYCASTIRLESVQNAVDQARTVAARLVGKPAPFTALPWFWTDQGDLKLQIAGLLDGHDQTVLIGEAESKHMSVLCFRLGRLIAADEASAPGFDLKAYEAATRPAA